ncbi:hypothetical protein FA13DRAFT_1418424 [Coprinellus micaceus]|uniref:Uncharacterized protein n=1 Tax=Coprinellus micaceus TaxID=71717 RepID=A0A4Y7SNJ6_COPMI|nr:hypothetical protein FA13DRAFT_1418424 [Coprinellus micaceus]
MVCSSLFFILLLTFLLFTSLLPLHKIAQKNHVFHGLYTPLNQRLSIHKHIPFPPGASTMEEQGVLPIRPQRYLSKGRQHPEAAEWYVSMYRCEQNLEGPLFQPGPEFDT